MGYYNNIITKLIIYSLKDIYAKLNNLKNKEEI